MALVKRQLSSLWPMRSNSCWQIPGQSVAGNCAGRHSRMSHVCSKILRWEASVGPYFLAPFFPKVKSPFLLFSSHEKQSLLRGLRYIIMIWWPISVQLHCAHVCVTSLHWSAMDCIPKVIRGGDPSQDFPLWKYRPIHDDPLFFLDTENEALKIFQRWPLLVVKNEWEKKKDWFASTNEANLQKSGEMTAINFLDLHFLGN